ncbi:hypothetical protein K0C01_05045 [Salinarchaeum sp. IM2453]|uniref:hypothetical protein n=1 Tax=Salinarchaeum sp. IM2453 TaxID=2862870 RepID=UPI001C83F2F3|nr:hypothetical protein [Salinarchaeum sp. IM2453]QZA89504.1 hypothetical protein K0C01_05045 [Salinarchaeum sp. IM2453]
MDRWLCWRKERDGDRIKKVPVDVNPNSESVYRVTYKEPGHWYTYQEAKKLVTTYDQIEGKQVVINDAKDPFVIVDFDDCIDPDTKRIDEPARKYLEQANTYAELSPSETGFHLVFQGKVPRQGWSAESDTLDLEVYEKYIVTVTEKHIEGTPYVAKRDDGLLDQIFEENNIRWREQLYTTEKTDDQLRTPSACL